MTLGGVCFCSIFFSLISSILPLEASPYPSPDQQPAILNNNAPFSGAIYIINPKGSSGSSCPAEAPQLCASGSTNWCCPPGYTCTSLADQAVGCCASSGSSCAAAPQLPTTTVVLLTVETPRPAQPQPPGPMTTVVNFVTEPAPLATGTSTAAGAFVGPVTAATAGTAGGLTTINVFEPVGASNGVLAPSSSYCSTMTMRGNNLPTVVAGPCGPMLIANAGCGLSPSPYSAALAGVWLLWVLGLW